MSLKSTFLALKKMVQVVQIRGRGGRWGWGRGNLDKIQKNSYFFRETFPESRNDCFQSIISFQFYSQYSNGTASRRAEGQLHAMVLLTP